MGSESGARLLSVLWLAVRLVVVVSVVLVVVSRSLLLLRLQVEVALVAGDVASLLALLEVESAMDDAE